MQQQKRQHSRVWAKHFILSKTTETETKSRFEGISKTLGGKFNGCDTSADDG
jgi:hypothetical protein